FQVAARLLLHWHFRAAAPAEKLAEQIAKAASAASAGAGCALSAAKIESAKIEIDVRAAILTASRRPRARLKILAVKSVLVVQLPLLRIRQHVIRFFQLLEFLLRALVSRIQVRVILPRQLAKSRANILRARL